MTTIITTEWEGCQREFAVNLMWGFTASASSTHTLDNDGLHPINKLGIDGHGIALRLIPRLHNFGGVTFEETGEVRLVELGEWYLGSAGSDVHYRSHPFTSPTASEFAILRPVRVEATDAIQDATKED